MDPVEVVATEPLWNSFNLIIAVGAIATIVAGLGAAASAFFAWRSSAASNRSAEFAAKESALRTRPWIFLDDVSFLSTSRIGFKVTNMGEMPGLNLTLNIANFIAALSDELSTEITIESSIGGDGVVFPGTSYTFIADFQIPWIPSLLAAYRTLEFECCLEYSFGASTPFTTTFQVSIGPGIRDMALDAVPRLFSNIGAS